MPLQKYDIRQPASQGGGFVERYWSPVNAPVLSKDGDVLPIIHRVDDITEFARTQKTLERDGESARVELLARSHEFRTPLNLLMGPLDDLLARSETLPAADRSRVELAHRNSLRLVKLVNTAASAIEGERGRLHELLMRAPAIICVLRGPRHVIELANEHYLRLVRRSAQIVGQRLMEALPELEGQGYLEILDRVFANGEPFVGREM
ncbi:MAG: hypothetical protein V4773_12760, partial [Verrucomicrobiota bacterium]